MNRLSRSPSRNRERISLRRAMTDEQWKVADAVWDVLDSSECKDINQQVALLQDKGFHASTAADSQLYAHVVSHYYSQYMFHYARSLRSALVVRIEGRLLLFSYKKLTAVYLIGEDLEVFTQVRNIMRGLYHTPLTDKEIVQNLAETGFAVKLSTHVIAGALATKYNGTPELVCDLTLPSGVTVVLSRRGQIIEESAWHRFVKRPSTVVSTAVKKRRS